MAPTIDAANNAIAISVFTFGFSFFWLMFWTHQEHKKTADLHQAAESSVEIFSFGKSKFFVRERLRVFSRTARQN
jgi:hypothetical protein